MPVSIHRTSIVVLCLCAVSLSGCATGGRAAECCPKNGQWSFDEDQPGRLPAGWRIDQTRPSEALATWKVIADADAPSARHVLALTETRNVNGTFNLAIADATTFRDLDLTVKVKAVSGEIDQGGGPIWRCQNADNYYICRINPLESNYRVYKVVGGERRQLDSAKVELQAGRWYTLHVSMVGDRITCDLDGKRMLEAQDEAIPAPGRVGLWTKADAVTSFDDLSVRSAVTPEPDSNRNR